MMLQENFSYGHISRGNMHNRNSLAFLEACYRADAKDIAAKVAKSVKTDLQQQLKFYNSLQGNKAEMMAYDKKNTEDLLTAMDRMESMYGGKAPSPEKGTNLNVNPAIPTPRPDGTAIDSGTQ
jgi:hypothetical protein